LADFASISGFIYGCIFIWMDTADYW
jgi:hypothetical protein